MLLWGVEDVKYYYLLQPISKIKYIMTGLYLCARVHYLIMSSLQYEQNHKNKQKKWRTLLCHLIEDQLITKQEDFEISFIRLQLKKKIEIGPRLCVLFGCYIFANNMLGLQNIKITSNRETLVFLQRQSSGPK